MQQSSEAAATGRADQQKKERDDHAPQQTVAVVIDVSASMHGLLGKLVDQLMHVVTQWGQRRLPPSLYLLAFADVVQPALLPSEPAFHLPADEQRVRTWLDKLSVGRGTNTMAALEAALSYPNLTHILLMTDGPPNSAPRAIFRKTKEAFDSRQIQTSAIFTGSAGTFQADSAELSFVRNLAAAGGGRCLLAMEISEVTVILPEVELKLNADDDNNSVQRVVESTESRDPPPATTTSRRKDDQDASAVRSTRDEPVVLETTGETLAQSPATYSDEEKSVQHTPEQDPYSPQAIAIPATSSAVESTDLANSNTVLFAAAGVLGFAPGIPAGSAPGTMVKAGAAPALDQGGYVLALPSQQPQLHTALQGRYFPGVITLQPPLDKTADERLTEDRSTIAVRFYTGEHDTGVPCSAARLIQFDAFCNAVQHCIDAQEQADCVAPDMLFLAGEDAITSVSAPSSVVVGALDAGSSSRPATGRATPSVTATAASSARHSHRRTVDREAAHAENVQHQQQLNILKDNEKRQARDPQRRLQRRLRDASVQQQELAEMERDAAHRNLVQGQTLTAVSKARQREQRTHKRFDLVLATMRKEHEQRQAAAEARAAFLATDEEQRVLAHQAREALRRQQLNDLRASTDKLQQLKEQTAKDQKLHRVASGQDRAFDSEASELQAIESKREVNVARMAAASQQQRDTEETLTQRIQYRRELSQGRREQERLDAEISQLLADSEVLARQRAQELRTERAGATGPSTGVPPELLQSTRAQRQQQYYHEQQLAREAKEIARAELRRAQVEERTRLEREKNHRAAERETARMQFNAEKHAAVHRQRELDAAHAQRAVELQREHKLKKRTEAVTGLLDRREMSLAKEQAVIDFQRETQTQRMQRHLLREQIRDQQENLLQALQQSGTGQGYIV